MSRVTLADVAALAGVSRSTASLVVRETGSLPDATRQRVRDAMASLGYVYNRGAAGLRSNSSRSVGLIVPDISNGFTAEMAIAMEETFDAAGRVTLLANALEDPARQDRLIQSMLERNVDGIVLMPAVHTDVDAVRRLVASRRPVTIAARHLLVDGTSYAGIDNVAGGRLAATHLLAHGARTFGYLGGEADLAPRQDRLAGIVAALATSVAALSVNLPGPFHGAWGREATARLIADDTLPDALICHNDLVAFGAYRAIREHLPERSGTISIVSFDDIASAALWEPPLTTITARGEALGAQCAEVMLTALEHPGRDPHARLVIPQLTVRESCGCPPRHL